MEINIQRRLKFIILYMIKTIVLQPIVLAELLTFGTSSYEVREDYIYPVTLSQPFSFAGGSHTTIYVSDNGVISLDAGFKGGTLDKYQYDIQWIAPYGADVGGGSHGLIYYMEVPPSDTATIQSVKEIIQTEYPDSSSFTPVLLFVVTWENVRPFPSAANTEENTFQAILTTDGSESYIVFLYGQLEWGPAVVGISSGTKSNKYFICDSRTNSVKRLAVKSQNECHTSGQYVFRVDNSSFHTGEYTCTPMSSPRDCTIAVDSSARNRRCGVR